MTIDFSERKSFIKRQFRSRLNLDDMSFILGDTDGTINNPNFPGKVWVQCYAAGGLLGHRSVYGPTRQMPMVPGMPVRLKYDRKGRLQIDEIDQDAQLATGVPPAAIIQQYGSSSTPQNAVETLAAVPLTGLSVSVKAWNPIVNGIYYRFSGASIDLSTADSGSSFVPSAGEKRMVVIFVKSDFATLEATGSTPVPISDPDLGEEDVQECLGAASPGGTPACAIQLIGGQTLVVATDITNEGDLRQMVNTRGTYFYTPSGTADTAGHLYDMAYDDSYLYLKTVAGWKRTALSTF